MTELRILDHTEGNKLVTTIHDWDGEVPNRGDSINARGIVWLVEDRYFFPGEERIDLWCQP